MQGHYGRPRSEIFLGLECHGRWHTHSRILRTYSFPARASSSSNCDYADCKIEKNGIHYELTRGQIKLIAIVFLCRMLYLIFFLCEGGCGASKKVNKDGCETQKKNKPKILRAGLWHTERCQRELLAVRLVNLQTYYCNCTLL